MDKKLNVFLVLIFFVGVIVRFIVFFANNSYIHDDAALALNIVTKNYVEFFKGLNFCQVAPPFFLILSKFIYHFLPKNYYYIDLGLKTIPLLSGILAIPAFYYLSKVLIKDKNKLLLANMLFVFNPLMISLCGRFKQYSTEVAIGICLYIILYKLLSCNVWKKQYSALIIIAPWFSLSALIIIFTYFLNYLFLYRKSLNKYFMCSSIISILLFSVIFIPDNLHTNYAGMNNFWSQYGFMSFIHPQRFLLRLGEFFIHNQKFIETILGIIIIFKIYEFIKNNSFIKKIFITAPIFITLILSFMHLYPFTDRLIAFLFPIFAILMAEYNHKIWTKISVSLFIVSSFICSFLYISTIYNLPDYRNNVGYYKDNPNIHEAYKPFYPTYKWYTHLDKND